MSGAADAVVVGAGPNGLVAANVLADAGWSVVVLEANAVPGGAVRSSELLEPGFVTDHFSAFYPLAAASPHIERLELERHGLVWCEAPAVLAHPHLDAPAAVLHRDPARTAATLDRATPGDGLRWCALQEGWQRVQPDMVRALLEPFPPVRAGARLAARLRLRGLGELARTAALPVQRLGDEAFEGAGGPLLLAGSALHADLTPQSVLSGLLGLLLAGIGQSHGWPVPRGGAGSLIDALVARLRERGGQLRCDAPVTAIEVGRHGAEAVIVGGQERVGATRAVLADVTAPALYGHLLAGATLPAGLRADLRRYQPGSATFKINWSLDRPIPWTDPTVREAGTVHVADSLDELTMTAAQLATDRLPSHPFVLVGQMATADATRAPAGAESAWAYTSVPQRVRGDAAGQLAGLDRPDDVERFAARMEARIEALAPGFRSAVRQRWIQTPSAMEAEDANLIGGDKNLGTAQLHQQLVFRPTLGWGRATTPVPRLFLASASAHPGGGVHGACGANAARAALAAHRRSAITGSLRAVTARRRMDTAR